MQNSPKYIILPNKVYELSISKTTTERAFYRNIIDFQVAAHNPLNNTDAWATLIGLSNDLSEDYPSYKQQVPLEWVLIRFLSHHVRTNSVHILSGRGGEVLLTASFRDYLGKEVADDDAEEVLRIVLGFVYSQKKI